MELIHVKFLKPPKVFCVSFPSRKIFNSFIFRIYFIKYPKYGGLSVWDKNSGMLAGLTRMRHMEDLASESGTKRYHCWWPQLEASKSLSQVFPINSAISKIIKVIADRLGNDIGLNESFSWSRPRFHLEHVLTNPLTSANIGTIFCLLKLSQELSLAIMSFT